MDISLPDRWGTEVLKIVIDQQAYCKFILYSGGEHADELDFEPLRRQGYNFEWLASPLDIQNLLRILDGFTQQLTESGNQSA